MRRQIMLLVLVVFMFVLLVPAGASAALTGVSARFCGATCLFDPITSAKAGENRPFRIDFTTSVPFNGLTHGIRIDTTSSPIGAQFPNSTGPNSGMQIGYGEGGYSVAGVAEWLNNGRTVTYFPNNNSLSLPAGATVDFNFGQINNNYLPIQPTVAGTYFLHVSTTAPGDDTPVASTSYTILPGDLAALGISQGAGQAVYPGQEFTVFFGARLRDAYNNNIQSAGTEVRFVASHGSFVGGTPEGTGSAVTVSTNVSGIAHSPRLTAPAYPTDIHIEASVVDDDETSPATWVALSLAPPDALAAAGGDNQSTKVTTAFAAPLQAQVLDTNHDPAAVEDIDVTFTASDGEFEDGELNDEGESFVIVPTDDEGIATAPELTAPEWSGPIEVVASADYDGEPLSNYTFNLEALADDPVALELELDPASIPADRTTTTIAYIDITDQYENGVPGLDPIITSSGGQLIGPVDDDDGFYSVEIRSTTATGEFTISASLPGTDLSATATLTQTRDSIKPKIKLTKKPKKKWKKKKAAYAFRSASADVARYECKVNGKPFRKCKSTFKFKAKKGTNRFKVRAVDHAGNRSKTISHKFRRVA